MLSAKGYPPYFFLLQRNVLKLGSVEKLKLETFVHRVL
jgi:hypothetical protein